MVKKNFIYTLTVNDLFFNTNYYINHLHMDQILSEILQKYSSQLQPLSKEELLDKIRGCIYGQALGDAIGIRTEFLSADEASDNWRNRPLTLLGWEKRRKFPEGDWSDDTDQMIVILNSYLQSRGWDLQDFAKKLREWKKKGFRELGDKSGLGCGYTVSRVISHKEFLTNPHMAALDIWIGGQCNLAANGALMRSCILGIINYNNTEQVIRQTKEIGKCTHADPRSLAASIAQTVAISLMLQGMRDANTITEASYEITSNFLQNYSNTLDGEVNSSCKPEKIEEYNTHKGNIGDHFNSETLRRYMNIDLQTLAPIDGEDMGYAYICLGCTFHALRQDNYEDTIRDIIIQGGDADTNAAAAGALLGCKVGFSGLPQNLVQQLLHKDWLEEKITHLINRLGFLTV
ncbi:unnamed protein product [Blepharisma stoltei]|uniref:ADP-ribosylglycohydrolase n=1 Tax=Blepharisma stoltei TaxID=1481888 RepID=A0AAU9JTR3_9CILI|nr:unnamed protein product [Blepharisma stoltei]